MCRMKNLRVLMVATLVALAAGAAQAETPVSGGWSARAAAASARADLPRPADADAPALPSGEETAKPTANAKARGLTGTWRVYIPQSNGGFPPFNAYHTFNADGTFTEVSDLLTTLTESPAHGVWSGKKSDYQLTFELFVFDPQTKAPAGRVRVRCAITLSEDGNSFTAQSLVDFIEPGGTIIEAVDSGPFTGTRVTVVPASGT